MIKILIQESNQVDFDSVQNILTCISPNSYLLERLATTDIQQFKQQRYDLLLFSINETDHKNVTFLQSILEKKHAKPVIAMTDASNPAFDQSLIEFGADDCLPKNELTPAFLKHAIHHAIRRKFTEAKLAHIATHDRLTGLANRYLLNQHLEHAISMSKRSSCNFAVLFIDLDKFKLVNDSLGHEIGDIILKQTANRLTQEVRETDIVARLGNDEFAVLVENIDSANNAAKVAEKIQLKMRDVFTTQEHELFLSASIGIAIYPQGGTQPNKLIKNAEIALSKAKQGGRNHFQVYTQELNQQAKLKLELEKNLRRALINGEFEIHLQPQINPHTQAIAGAEALLRWNHPTQGQISPVVFIPLLDDLGLLPGVESWVINQVCLLAKSLTDEFGKMRFSVNISGSHFKAGSLKENIFAALQTSNLNATYLEIELTEDIMIEHVEKNSHLLSELKELGISVALDDFGKGYSSLSYLKNFPADILKIDKAFIDNLTTDSRDASIVESLIELSHKLGIQVVAEGVEDKNQLIFLRNMRCDYIQGYYFAKPMSKLDFKHFVEKHKHQQTTNSINIVPNSISANN
ncbi:EAL domain-containing protein [Aliikangiella sp. IMCC44653]